MGLEWSHGKRRPTTPRPNGNGESIPPLPPPNEAERSRDVQSGRFVPGKRTVLKTKAKGITTLAPIACPDWLQPHIEEGAEYALALLERCQGDRVLARLAGDTADAHAVYRGYVALAVQGDMEAAREARAWLREHRSCLATFSALANEIKQPSEEVPWLATFADVSDPGKSEGGGEGTP